MYANYYLMQWSSTLTKTVCALCKHLVPRPLKGGVSGAMQFGQLIGDYSKGRRHRGHSLPHRQVLATQPPASSRLPPCPHTGVADYNTDRVQLKIPQLLRPAPCHVGAHFACSAGRWDEGEGGREAERERKGGGRLIGSGA